MSIFPGHARLFIVFSKRLQDDELIFSKLLKTLTKGPSLVDTQSQV